MCSVLQRPIPSAPNSIALRASSGLSAFVLILRLLIPSAHDMITPKSPDRFGSTVWISPSYTFPSYPSSEIISPSPKTLSFVLSSFLSSETMISEQPATQHLPICLATTAACDVTPPFAVSIPPAAIIPARSSGDVVSLTSMAFSPFFTAASASRALKYIFPLTAPGDAGSPFATAETPFSSFSSNLGWRS